LLIDILSNRTDFLVKEAEDKEEILPQVIYIAPADYHLLIERDRTFSLDDSERVNYSRPSIDVTFQSGAEVYGDRAIALLLSGASEDGVEGLLSIRKNGGLVAVQDPASALVAWMPQQALDKMPVDVLLNPDNLDAFMLSI
jgi:two-component system chemotaxis response regulator CheB